MCLAPVQNSIYISHCNLKTEQKSTHIVRFLTRSCQMQKDSIVESSYMSFLQYYLYTLSSYMSVYLYHSYIYMCLAVRSYT